ncbi:MAG: glycosyltransferase family 4 protein [Flavobacteriaceae bacterium]
MKILFLTDNFPPESNAPATRTYEHCSQWVSLGYDVTVITCFPNFPTGKVYDGYKNKLYSREVVNGINIVRVWSFITLNQGFVRRILDFISFACSSFIYGLFVKTDIIVATSPQFFTAISARYLSLFKNKPWVMEIRDIWPNSIVVVGSMSKKSPFYKALKLIERRLYQSAKKLVVVTDSFKTYLITNHHIDSNKIGVFKNGINLEAVKKN